MTDATSPRPPFEDLDGCTLEQLDDYLDRGRSPADPAIEGSPACRIALAALERLRAMAGTLLEEDAAAAPRDREPWVGEVMSRISIESRAGRRFAFPADLPGVEAVVTEGALRGLVRAIGDSVPGLLTGRVRLRPDETGDLVDVEVEANLLLGYSAPAAAAELRERVATLLPQHAPFAVRRVDLRIRDLIRPAEEGDA